MHNQAKFWHAVDVEVETDAVEAIGYALMEGGALGTETNQNVVTGYFDALPSREELRGQFADALRIYALPSSSIRDMSLREVENQDWLGEWKKNWQPVEIGRFVVAPPWSEVPQANDRIVIRIEPGMAFGTGTHETTRLCLSAVEKYFEGGSFLDVGTGTGILAIAAAKLFPESQVSGCDNDEQALEIALENSSLNGTAGNINFRVGSVEDDTPSADFVCANLTADVIVELLPKLIGVTCGRLVLSGILDTQVEDVRARLRECGVTGEVETHQDDEWVALII